MTKKDRKVMEKVYQAVNRMSRMCPTNPADLKDKIRCLDKVNKASRHLVMSLSALNCEDYESASDSADEALQALDE